MLRERSFGAQTKSWIPANGRLAQWARSVATDPNAIEARDVQRLRDAGFDEAQIFAITTFVALRLAFSTVNDALGARPDSQLGGFDAGAGSVRRHVRPPLGA